MTAMPYELRQDEELVRGVDRVAAELRSIRAAVRHADERRSVEAAALIETADRLRADAADRLRPSRGARALTGVLVAGALAGVGSFAMDARHEVWPPPEGPELRQGLDIAGLDQSVRDALLTDLQRRVELEP